MKAHNQTKTAQGALKHYSFKGLFFFFPLERIELVSNLNPLLDLFKQPCFQGLASLAVACFAGFGSAALCGAGLRLPGCGRDEADLGAAPANPTLPVRPLLSSLHLPLHAAT